MSDWKTPTEVRRDDAVALARIETGSLPAAAVNCSDRALFRRCWLRLANGWTVSISEDDTPPAICCLAAWPTRQDDIAATQMVKRFDKIQFFDFGGGDGHPRTDCRCWTFTDVREALITVAAAMAPSSASDRPRETLASKMAGE